MKGTDCFPSVCSFSHDSKKYYHENSHGHWDLFSSIVEMLSSLSALAKINYFCYKVIAEFRRPCTLKNHIIKIEVFKGASGGNDINAGKFKTYHSGRVSMMK